ncbi:hypothetical protein AB0L00_28500 [Actinoallomurus sp. NPDC052308]|uniref:hypothetical protein n=1 Tax=Actinoallomurus sp. NPDC052308 TaxID=3155530 RepID=UPI0034185830
MRGDSRGNRDQNGVPIHGKVQHRQLGRAVQRRLENAHPDMEFTRYGVLRPASGSPSQGEQG